MNLSVTFPWLLSAHWVVSGSGLHPGTQLTPAGQCPVFPAPGSSLGAGGRSRSLQNNTDLGKELSSPGAWLGLEQTLLNLSATRPGLCMRTKGTEGLLGRGAK